MVYELRVWFMNRRELNQDSIFLIDHKTTGTSSKLFFSISAVLLSQYDPTRISIFILPLKRYIFGPYLDQGFSMAIWPYYALLMNQYVALFFFRSFLPCLSSRFVVRNPARQLVREGSSSQVFKWNCGIPGRAKGPWEAGCGWGGMAFHHQNRHGGFAHIGMPVQ